MPDLIPPSLSLVPAPAELRHRLAVALREVDLLRRLIRVADHAAHYRQSDDANTGAAVGKEASCAH
jgi:hypothetical protein